ncbi:MAG: ABC transporter ATP-binding protein [Anaerolineales bacterium]|nr:ABC transporter ATP-binding protein [Anaerolineales bacterium]
MSDVAIKVENLSKRYRIGLKEAVNDTFVGAISAVVQHPLKNLRQLHRLSAFSEAGEDSGGILWALKDISFQVEQGEVLGIIGRNGAGKTTLLKILSKITYPTSGRVEMKGRVASLLEIGTGFHPELTGRENIYLNGTLLGMTKREIDRKLDEIIDFSGVEKFIDTPVKRYSSGMRVRLAFSVAAFLEAEILLIDEVLAVGDTGFQKKSLGKMEEAAYQGRTILFVSHSMAAILALCTRGYLLELGRGTYYPTANEAVNKYLTQLAFSENIPLDQRIDREGSGKLKFVSVRVLGEEEESLQQVVTGQKITISLQYDVGGNEPLRNTNFGVIIFGNLGQQLFVSDTEMAGTEIAALPGRGEIKCEIPNCPLSPGDYRILVWAVSNYDLLDRVESATTFSVHEGDFFGTGKLPYLESQGVFIPHHWKGIKNGKRNSSP